MTLSTRGGNRRPEHISQVRRPGSNEMLVGAGGNLNAGSNAELIQTIATVMDMQSRGEITARRHVEAGRKVQFDIPRSEVIAAFDNKNSRAWAALGATISGEVSLTQDREGFMRRLLVRSDLTDGQVPRIRVKRKKTVAVIASGPSQHFPEYQRDEYIYPPEFYVKANVRVEEKELRQGTADILEDAFFESQEAIMTQEDRTWKAMADSTVSMGINPSQIFSGGLTPTGLATMRSEITQWGLSPATIVMASNVWTNISGNGSFTTWFDPVSQYEMVMTGYVGTIMGLGMITDQYREPKLKVLNAGEIYMVAAPETHGTYTDRGPVTATEVNQYPDNVPARGWAMNELISMVIHNPRSIVKGVVTS